MAKKPHATLMEIAKAANVSATTVSNVVNGRLHLMSDDTRRRVEALVREHNYRPNEEARNLRMARRRTVGLIVVDDSPAFLADPMITNIVAGLSNHLGVNGYGLLITGLTHAALDSAPMLRRNQTDAVCLLPSGSAAERRRLFGSLRQLGQPVVVFQDEVPDDLGDALSVRQDDRKAGRLIAQRAVMRGARRLVFLTPAQNWLAMSRRQQGLQEVADASGARLQVVVCGSESLADTQLAIDRYAQNSLLPDMLIGGNDQMAIAALNWAFDRNLRVPADLKVAGFNGFDFVNYARPRPTTVVSPAYEMGRQGAQSLLTRLQTGTFSQRDLVFDVHLQEGGTD